VIPNEFEWKKLCCNFQNSNGKIDQLLIHQIFTGHLLQISTYKTQLSAVKIKGWKGESEKGLKELITVKYLTRKCSLLLSYSQRAYYTVEKLRSLSI